MPKVHKFDDDYEDYTGGNKHESKIKCDECGHVCSAEDAYCEECGARLILEMDVSEIDTMLDDHYEDEEYPELYGEEEDGEEEYSNSYDPDEEDLEEEDEDFAWEDDDEEEEDER